MTALSMARDAAVPSREPELERARGRLGLVVRNDGVDSIADLRQEGCGRFLFPARAANEPLQAVIANTAGGLTGGDRFDVMVGLGEHARASIATQACEKIYRSGSGAGRVRTRLRLDAGAKLHWLPQETILFEGSRLERQLDIEMSGSARLLVAEAVILGRAAMGETLATASFRDSWRIRRDGRLAFAEETACDGAWRETAAARAATGEAGAFATVILAARDAEASCGPARDILESHGIDGGASVVDGLLIVRLVAGPGLALRRGLVPLLEYLGGQALPRVWTT
jgi:urease accessory protein